MQENKEIHALMQLIDDPDQEVFDTVATKIIHYGKQIIPNLEYLWEQTPSESIQERIELLIHRVNFQDLRTEFLEWSRSENPDLLSGCLLVCRYQYPDFNENGVIREIEKIKRNIWLELNNYLTPLEQVNVLNSMIYSFSGIKGTEISYLQPNHFLLNQVLDSKRGNSLAIGILYQLLCERLDLTVFAVHVPRQFILAYFDQYQDLLATEARDNLEIQFYIDPQQGQIYTQKDVDLYLKRIGIEETENLFNPLSNLKIIKLLLEEYAKCFDQVKDQFRKEELQDLASLIAQSRI